MANDDETPPIHDCPVQGKGTEYIRTLNIKTNERGWICFWCEMANTLMGGSDGKQR